MILSDLVSVSQQLKTSAYICYLKTNVHDHILYKIKIDELKQLIKALNIKVEDIIVQTRFKSSSNLIFGKGKVEELKRRIYENNIPMLIFYNRLSSKQRLNLNRALNCMILDRTDIILELFKRGADDRVSLLQIEYAELKRMIPYFKLVAHEKFVKEHPFFRSRGEYAYHSKVRAYYKKLSKLKREVDYYFFIKKERIKKRKALNKPFVCLSGYYNAGKTTLFNMLTGEKKDVSNRPFTTLSSKYQKSTITDDLLFIDTIGFVSDIDFRILKSFSLNMLDIKSSDIILFAIELEEDIDVIRFKLKEGLKIYAQLGIEQSKILVLLTKRDTVPTAKTRSYEEEIKKICGKIPYISISVKYPRDIELLLNKIKMVLDKY